MKQSKDKDQTHLSLSENNKLNKNTIKPASENKVSVVNDSDESPFEQNDDDSDDL